MKIELMNDSHLEKILKIDQNAFQRDEPRTVPNLKGLREGDPEGCFVLMDGTDLVGYSFNKTMGAEGYLGPVGIQTSLHGQGWGQKLIQRSLDYLKSRCSVIGLEVRPELGSNIGLYHKMGFQSAFPSMIMEIPEKFEIRPELDLEDHDNKMSNYGAELYSEMSDHRRETVLDEIDLWTSQELHGKSYRKDLELTHADGGQIIIISQGKEPLGFLAFYSIVFLHMWGAMKPTICQKAVLRQGLQFFRDINGQEEVLVEVNTRYQKLVDLFMEEHFKIIKSVNRMLLKGFEGQHLNKSPDFVMRAWHA